MGRVRGRRSGTQASAGLVFDGPERIATAVVLATLIVAPAQALHPAAHIGFAQPSPVRVAPTIRPGLVPPTSVPAKPPKGPASSPAKAPAAGGKPTTRISSTSVHRARATRGDADRSVTGRMTSFTPDLAGFWELWWQHNSDQLLALHHDPRADEVPPSTLGVLTGRGRRSAGSELRRPSEAMVAATILPDVLQLLATCDDPVLTNAVLMTLGRIAPADSRVAVRAAMVGRLRDDDWTVQATAALALGILGDPAAAADLRALLEDGSAGRRLVGGGAVPAFVRAVSAVSLGLIGQPEDAQTLLRAIDAVSPAEGDVTACCIAALGLLESSGELQAVEGLLGLLARDDLSPEVRSYIPTSLGKVGDRTALPRLLAVLEDDHEPSAVRQSAAIAVGRLALPVDAPAVEALARVARAGGDEATRHFAWIALGRIGARTTESADDGAGRRLILAALHDEVRRPSRRDGRPWAVLGAALSGRSRAEGRDDLVDAVRDALREEHDPSRKGACALALGLLGAGRAAPDVQADFQETRDQDFRGFAALSLGLLRHRPAAEALRAACRDRAATSTYRLHSAIGLALMEEQSATTVLIEVLADDPTTGVREGACRALGVAGDIGAVVPLLDMLRDDSLPEVSRAFACVGLGILAERDGLPWNARISEDNNYLVSVPAMEMILGVL